MSPLETSIILSQKGGFQMVFPSWPSSIILTFSIANWWFSLLSLYEDDHPHNWGIAPLLLAASKPTFYLEPKLTGGCNALMTRYVYNAQPDSVSSLCMVAAKVMKTTLKS